MIFHYNMCSDFKSTHDFTKSSHLNNELSKKILLLLSASIVWRADTYIVGGRWRLIRGLTRSYHLRWYCGAMISMTCIVGCYRKVVPRWVSDIPFFWEIHAPDLEEISHGPANVFQIGCSRKRVLNL